MIFTLEEAKSFLRVDFDDDNEEIIDCIKGAEQYLKEATGKEFTSENYLARKYCKHLIIDWYENKDFMEGKNVSGKVRFTLQSILNQLKYGD